MNIEENSSYRNHTAMHSGAASPLLEEQVVEKPVSSLSKSQKFYLIMLLLTLGLLIILPLCLAGFAVTFPHVGSFLFFLIWSFFYCRHPDSNTLDCVFAQTFPALRTDAALNTPQTRSKEAHFGKGKFAARRSSIASRPWRLQRYSRRSLQLVREFRPALAIHLSP